MRAAYHLARDRSGVLPWTHRARCVKLGGRQQVTGTPYLGEKARVHRQVAACNPRISESACSATSINRRGDVGSARVARAFVELDALGEIVRTQPPRVSVGCVPVDPSCAKSAQRVVVVVGAKSQAKDIANRSGSAMS